MCKLFFFLSVFGICKAAPLPALSSDVFVGPSLAATVSGTCTYTRDSSNNVIMGPGCTAADLFKDAAAGDFRLVLGAPAIGNAVCLLEVPTDFDGNPRPTPGEGCDIGAFQFRGTNPTRPDPPTNLRQQP
jgi:hypothetical protein